MRGKTNPQGSLFFSINIEDRIRSDHPLRPIKRAVEMVLGDLTSLLENLRTARSVAPASPRTHIEGVAPTLSLLRS